jgi:hypothetical protein
MTAYMKNTERAKINDLMLHLKLREKLKNAKPKTNRREVMKIRPKSMKQRPG